MMKGLDELGEMLKVITSIKIILNKGEKFTKRFFGVEK